MSPTGRRLLLLTHDWGTERAEAGLVAAMQRHLDVVVHDVDVAPVRDLPALVERSEADLVATFWRFRYLDATDVNWTSYRGRKVLIDHDAFGDFIRLGQDFRGRWTSFLRRNQFDQLIVSGQRSYEHFSALGFHTGLVHKGFDPQLFHINDDGVSRSGLCCSGTRYRSRAAMMRVLERANVPFAFASAPYSQFGAELRKHSGLLTTCVAATVRFGKVGRGIERFRPGTVLRMELPPEPMLKHFEASASGCAVFTDRLPDLEGLGFVEGEHYLGYDTFDELAELALSHLARPDDLNRIGAAAARLCAARHTWDHRATAIGEILFGRAA